MTLNYLVAEYVDSQVYMYKNEEVSGPGYKDPGIKEKQKRHLRACKNLQEYVMSNLPAEDNFSIYNGETEARLVSLIKETGEELFYSTESDTPVCRDKFGLVYVFGV
jgi:hypothetical protein